MPVTGTITYNNTPVEGALVVFTPPPASPTKPANGTTDAQGKYTLQTYLGGATGITSGAMEGDFTVTVVKKSGAAAAAASGKTGSELLGDPSKMAKPPTSIDKNEGSTVTALDVPGSMGKDELPAKYNSAATSDLKATVKKDGANDFPFNLQD